MAEEGASHADDDRLWRKVIYEDANQPDIRMRLWVDTFNARIAFGMDSAIAWANDALKAFDAQFPEKESEVDKNPDFVKCLGCGKSDYPAHMFFIDMSWYCKPECKKP